MKEAKFIRRRSMLIETGGVFHSFPSISIAKKSSLATQRARGFSGDGTVRVLDKGKLPDEFMHATTVHHDKVQIL